MIIKTLKMSARKRY
ncbi:hypothetical protein ACBQ34_10105 [Escherichia coli]